MYDRTNWSMRSWSNILGLDVAHGGRNARRLAVDLSARFWRDRVLTL